MTVVGNMWKSVLDNIASGSPKVEAAFNALGISMYTIGADGQKQLKPIWDLLLELSQAAEHATVSQTEYFSTIAGGKYQFDTLRAAVSDLTTLQDAYNISVNSTGETQTLAAAKMHTLSVELQRLKDSISQLSYNLAYGSSGIGDVLKGLVVGLDDFINGLQKVPTWLGWSAAGLAGVLLAGRTLTGVLNTLSSLFNVVRNGLQFWASAANAATASVVSMAGATTAFTADLEAKTIATQADVAANEEEVVSSTAASAAIEAEGAAAETAAAGMMSLDAAAAGITMGLSVLIPIVAAATVAIGAHTKATQEAAQSAQDMSVKLQQEIAQEQSNANTMVNNINTIQGLKKAYDQAKQALDTAKEGSQQYKQAQAELADIHEQLTAIVGKSAADQIMASKNVTKAMDDEISSMINDMIKAAQALQVQADNQAKLTQETISQSEARIAQYAREAQALELLAKTATDATANSPAMADLQGSKAFADDTRAKQLQSQIAQEKAIEQQAKDALKQAQQKASDAENLVSQLKNIQAQHNANPNATVSMSIPDPFGSGTALGTPSSGGGGSTKSGSGSSKKKATGPTHQELMQAYLQQIDNIQKGDDYYLQPYTMSVNNAQAAVTKWSDALSTAMNNLKQNITDTKAASTVMSDYTNEVKAYNDHISALSAENKVLQGDINNVSEKIKQVTSDFKAGKIDGDTYHQSIYSLRQELDQLTQSLNSNNEAIQKDKDSMAQAAADIESQIISDLQSAYEDEQKSQEQILEDWYNNQKSIIQKAQSDFDTSIDNQIKSLQDQATAIDNVTKALQEQWNAQDEVNQLQDLQTQLQQVMADTRYQVIDQNGNVQWTYDQEKAAELQQQIAEQQTKIQQDQQLQQLNDQKDALDSQVQNLQDYKSQMDQQYQDQLQTLDNYYNDAKQKLDDYWSYRLQQDTLKQEADNLILQNGLSKALDITTQFAGQMVSQYNSVTSAAQQAAAAMAQLMGLQNAGGTSIGVSAPSIPTVPAPSISVPNFTAPTSSTTNSTTISISNVSLPSVTDGQSFVQSLTAFVQQLAQHGRSG
ncbi:hypothetical protein GCM10025857_14760 [Alicyclobacillus contaminans]|uniref:hypothetical protein n=1 Tax=Alicyclobacillus contaminans TaxID=392016 RepID=UPI0004157A92|nr:hypothetical protein [Alicyclobacillus contaminans]GMA50119.1 hypothetical protein GCM10025857_14760 [Alicyclobacillus contaminans]